VLDNGGMRDTKRSPWVILLSLLFTFTIVGVPVSRSAEADFVIDPVQIFNKDQPSAAARGVFFQENVNLKETVGWIRNSMIPTAVAGSGALPNAPAWWDYHLCAYWEDPACETGAGMHLDGRIQLGICSDSTELGCIESLWISNSQGVLEELKFKESAFGGVVDIPQSVKYGIPRSSSPPIFSSKGGATYIVRAGMGIVVEAGSTLYKLDVDVNPTMAVMNQSISAPKAIVFKDSIHNTGVVSTTGSPSECLATDNGKCYRALNWDPKTFAKVKIRLPKKVSGWIRGRVANQQISISPLNDSSQIFEVQAESVNVPSVGGWIKYSDLPNNFIKNLYPTGGYDENPNSVYSLFVDPSQGSQGINEFNTWIPYLKDRSLATLRSWSFGTNFISARNPCLAASGVLNGFVGTNATAYSSEPPTWNAATNTLSYQVASPHFDEKGNEAIGSYTLSLDSSVLKCLYKSKDLPTSATVQLVYSDGVSEIATVAIKNDGKWFNFSANGFHYSNPTVNVKFYSPVPTPSMSPKPSPVKTTINCVKGKLTRKVTAFSPSCPAGYKQK